MRRILRHPEAAGSASDDLLAGAPRDWDLTHVLPSRRKPDVDAALAKLEALVKEVEAARPTLDDIDDPADVKRLFDTMTELGEVAHRLDALGSLAFSVDTRDGDVKAYMNRMDTITTEAGNRVRFLSLWWKQLPEERAEALTPDDPDMRYYLRHLRAFRPHTLSEAEERIIAIKDTTGDNALSTVRQIITSGFRYVDPVTGKEVTEPELTKRAYHPDPKVREQTYTRLWENYEKHEPVLSTIYQATVTDWVNETVKLRGYPRPISARNLGNDVPDDVVDTLLDVVKQNRGIYHRYFQWKGKRVGLPEMTRHHIYAPLEEREPDIPWSQAGSTVLSIFDGFSPTIGRAARTVFDENHLHPIPREGKRGGAYCATITSKLTPYVFMNYTGDVRSVSTLAHEMGHAVHSVLARDRHPLVAHSSLPLAETASVFAEMLLHRKLSEEADAATRLSLTSDKVADSYATIMRQAYFVLFEQHAHDAIPEGASSDELQKAYLENLRDQFGPIPVPDHFKYEWTYIPHIFESPFYCYAYSFGMLLSLSLYGAYEEEGGSFVPRYEALLAAGGSAPAVELLDRVGYDAADPGFWQKGLDIIDAMVTDLEKNG